MKFFDANCRIGRGRFPAPDGVESVQDLLREMDEFGIDRALVHGSEARDYDPEEGNEALMELVAGHERLAPCWVAPAPDERGPLNIGEYMEKAVASGVRAFRVYLSEMTYNYPLNDWLTKDLLGALHDHHMPLFVGALESPWSDIRQLCIKYSNIPVVTVRPKYRETRWLYALMAELPNFHLTFSWLAFHRSIEDVCNRFGPERLLFSTHLPEFSPAITIGMVMYAQISEDDKQQLAFGNLDRLMGGVR